MIILATLRENVQLLGCGRAEKQQAKETIQGV